MEDNGLDDNGEGVLIMVQVVVGVMANRVEAPPPSQPPSQPLMEVANFCLRHFP